LLGRLVINLGSKKVEYDLDKKENFDQFHKHAHSWETGEAKCNAKVFKIISELLTKIS
jgi:hypothetical protein